MMGITCGYSPKPLNMKMSQRCVKNLSQVGCSFFTIFVTECTIFFESFSINALLVTSMTGLSSLVYSFRTDRMRLPFQLQSLQMRQSLLVWVGTGNHLYLAFLWQDCFSCSRLIITIDDEWWWNDVFCYDFVLLMFLLPTTVSTFWSKERESECEKLLEQMITKCKRKTLTQILSCRFFEPHKRAKLVHFMQITLHEKKGMFRTSLMSILQ